MKTWNQFGIVSIIVIGLLTACATTNKPKVNERDRFNDPNKAYVVVKIGNNTGKEMFATLGYPSILLRKALVDPRDSWLPIGPPSKGNQYLIDQVSPGTYQIDDFRVTKYGMTTVTYSYKLDKTFETFFKVNPGEVVYLGTFTMEDKNDALKGSFDLDALKAELVAKYPTLEGFHWVPMNEDRPSF